MTIEELTSYKKILLLGYGQEGKATHAFLKIHHPKAEIGIADKKDDSNYLDKQKDYDLIVRSPGIKTSLVQQKYTTATNIFFANIQKKGNITIGITGTEGKSSTSTLIHQMLVKAGKKSHLVGNIGKPMLEAYIEGFSNDDIFVIELSSYQLEDVVYSPHIACYLNIYREHHNHPDFDSYKRAKDNIAAFQTEKDYFIYNPNIKEIAQLVKKTKAHIMPLEQSSTQDNKAHLHWQSISAAQQVAGIFDLDDGIVKSAIESYKKLPHRLENVGIFQDITFIDDSASKHPSATLHALNVIKNVSMIMLGGEDRGQDFDKLVNVLEEKNIANIVLFPDTDDRIARLLSERSNYNPRIVRTDSMEGAVKKAYQHAVHGTACLLSPGAASYTMFSHFVERGKTYQKLVTHYAEEISKKKKNNTSQR